MKTEALQALQHVRTTLAYQLTPEAVSELLEPIQKALDGEVKELIAGPSVPLWAIDSHNAKVEEALEASYRCCRAHHDGSGFNDLFDAVDEAIRSLRL
jgi:hypothetical protein